jgi:bile acid:Na+ symporter, BASS family
MSADALKRADGWFGRNSTVLLIAVAAANLAFPEPALWLKALVVVRLPAGGRYDVATLALAVMMLSASLKCRPRDLKTLSPRRALVSLGLVYAIGPAIALALGAALFGGFAGEGARELRLGLCFVALMPVAMTAAPWVRLAGGNVAVALALIALTTALSVVVVPLYASALPVAPASAMAPFAEVSQHLMFTVALPLACGLSLRTLLPRGADRVEPAISLLGTASLFAALATNVAGASMHLTAELPALAVAAVGAVALNAAFFGVALLFARAQRARSPRMHHADAVALVLGGGMRSSGTAMVLAAACFPTMALVSVPAAVFSISQQLLAGLLVRALRPGGALLRPSIGRSRSDLEAALNGLRPDEPVGVVVLAVPPGSARAAAAMVRGYDYVSQLGEGELAVVLRHVSARQARQVAVRLEAALKPSRSALYFERRPQGSAELVDSAARMLGEEPTLNLVL